MDVVGLGSGVASVSVGNGFTCAMTTAGAVKCWGGRNYSFTPRDVVGPGSGMVAVSAGTEHTCALTNAGAAKCWGDNYYDELGDGTTTSSWTPVDVVGFP